MTMDEATRAELERMTNPEKVKEAAEQQERSNFRPKYLSFTCDIGDILGPYDRKNDKGETIKFPSGDVARGVAVQFKNMTIHKSLEPLQLVEHTHEMPWPQKANENTEVALMSKALYQLSPVLDSIVKWPGTKTVTFEERIHEYKARRETDRPMMKDGKQVIGTDGKPRKEWEDYNRKEWYFHAVSIGTAGGVSVPTSDDNIDQALALIPDEGIEEAAFKGMALRHPILQKDAALGPAISNGSFTEEMITKGKIKREDGKLLKV